MRTITTSVIVFCLAATSQLSVAATSFRDLEGLHSQIENAHLILSKANQHITLGEDTLAQSNVSKSRASLIAGRQSIETAATLLATLPGKLDDLQSEFGDTTDYQLLISSFQQEAKTFVLRTNQLQDLAQRLTAKAGSSRIPSQKAYNEWFKTNSVITEFYNYAVSDLGAGVVNAKNPLRDRHLFTAAESALSRAEELATNSLYINSANTIEYAKKSQAKQAKYYGAKAAGNFEQVTASLADFDDNILYLNKAGYLDGDPKIGALKKRRLQLEIDTTSRMAMAQLEVAIVEEIVAEEEQARKEKSARDHLYAMASSKLKSALNNTDGTILDAGFKKNIDRYLAYTKSGNSVLANAYFEQAKDDSEQAIAALKGVDDLLSAAHKSGLDKTDSRFATLKQQRDKIELFIRLRTEEVKSNVNNILETRAKEAIAAKLRAEQNALIIEAQRQLKHSESIVGGGIFNSGIIKDIETWIDLEKKGRVLSAEAQADKLQQTYKTLFNSLITLDRTLAAIKKTGVNESDSRVAGIIAKRAQIGIDITNRLHSAMTQSIAYRKERFEAKLAADRAQQQRAVYEQSEKELTLANTKINGGFLESGFKAHSEAYVQSYKNDDSDSAKKRKAKADADLTQALASLKKVNAYLVTLEGMGINGNNSRFAAVEKRRSDLQASIEAISKSTSEQILAFDTAREKRRQDILKRLQAPAMIEKLEAENAKLKQQLADIQRELDGMRSNGENSKVSNSSCD